MTTRRWLVLIAVVALLLAIVASGEFLYYPGETVGIRWKHFQAGFARMGPAAWMGYGLVKF